MSNKNTNGQKQPDIQKARDRLRQVASGHPHCQNNLLAQAFIAGLQAGAGNQRNTATDYLIQAAKLLQRL